MTKLDFRKRDKALYSGTPGQWALIDVPPMTYLSIRGGGGPDGAEYARALECLYPLAYAIKFAAKARGADFVVPPLDGLWWAEDPADFVAGRRANWQFRAMLRVPDDTAAEDFAAARAKVRDKGRVGEATLNAVSMEGYHEGPCFQTLHVGPYSAEAPVLAELHDRVMPEAGMTFGKPHHEIYLSDPRRVPPERLRTILRQPVVPA